MTIENRKTTQELMTEAAGYFEKYGLNETLEAFLSEPEVTDVIQKAHMKLEEEMKARVQMLPKDIQQKIEKRKSKTEYVSEKLLVDVIKSSCKLVIVKVVKEYENEAVSKEDITNSCKVLLGKRFNLEELWIIEAYASNAIDSVLATLDGILNGEIDYPFV